MHELALFTGAGGGLLGSHLLGWHTRCAVEIDPYCRSVLLARQQDGHLPRFPIWDDVRTFDGKPWRGKIDVISGGFPCQDISAAGKGAGLAGARSGLWFEMERIIGEVRPRFVFAENSPNLRTRGLGTVIEGLTRLGYDVRWGVLGAWHVGAPHKRNRMWIVAHAHSTDLRLQQRRGCGKSGETAPEFGDIDQRRDPLANTLGQRGGISGTYTDRHPRQPPIKPESHSDTKGIPFISPWPGNVPCAAGIPNGVANRVDRIRATGNGQVPAVAALAWEILTEGWG